MTDLVTVATRLYKECWYNQINTQDFFFDSPLDHTQNGTGLPGCCTFPSFQL